MALVIAHHRKVNVNGIRADRNGISLGLLIVPRRRNSAGGRAPDDIFTEHLLWEMAGPRRAQQKAALESRSSATQHCTAN